MSEGESWPASVFGLGVLKSLDQRGQVEVERAGESVRARSGDVIYESGELGDAFFVVVSGTVVLRAVRRGDEHPSDIRTVGPGQSFGEECALGGGKRQAQAVAQGDLALVKVPVVVFQRALERAGGSTIAAREMRRLRRGALSDLLRTVSLTRDLKDEDHEALLDAVEMVEVDGGQALFEPGDPARAAYLVVDGLLQLQTEDGDQVLVRAYLSPGDLLGDEAALAQSRHTVRAVALGKSACLAVPGEVLRGLADRRPELLPRARRVAQERGELQERVVSAAAANATQHVFRDLYRMQMARSLLAIDQDSCVRCGHCSWACADLYGTTRLIRRGDKVVTPLAAGAEATSLMLPNTCQHCQNPSCMLDCPTGAIGRDPVGDVFIRPELCTGCGACARACPWDNIQMVPRLTTGGIQTASPAPLSALLAVKCDLCREYEAPACVQVCPTESIVRLEPATDFTEVAAILGLPHRSQTLDRDPRRNNRAWMTILVAVASVLLGGAASQLHEAGGLSPERGAGLLAGWLALLGSGLLGAYGIVKRRVRAFMRPRSRSLRASRKLVRSRLAPWYRAHVLLGMITLAAVLAHAGRRLGPSTAGAVGACFWLIALSGLLGALCYAVLPPRLSRLERKGALPEDFGDEGDQLRERFYQRLSGRHALVKAIGERVLGPYLARPLGAVRLLVSGRSLREEEQDLRLLIHERLQSPGDPRLDGLDEILRLAVEMRALPARRLATGLLRGLGVTHALLAVLGLAGIAVHVISVLR